MAILPTCLILLKRMRIKMRDAVRKGEIIRIDKIIFFFLSEDIKYRSDSKMRTEVKLKISPSSAK